ncbi:hypothetical protein OHB35_04725 [Streptomyces phaeochromogenes]|uniref:Uncharacterized protein n=1 Tax=Streptomyces phaeochromogenes TaxID=1923 RepID=A0ABZ1H200_STRPH|nr:hypothetical protein [Streptomyces phaeochromogenes]WSD12583.1 hypothetical protein OHB35_04725 [Streptomyces phaeochromogenes]
MRRLSSENHRIHRIPRPSRLRRGAIPAALCALALTLTACGSERAAGKAPKAGTDDRVEAGSTATAPATAFSTDSSDPESSEPDFLPFMELLLSITEPCLKFEPTEEPPTEPPEEPDPTAPPLTPLPEPLPPDATPPPGEPIDPDDAKKEVELSPVEKCDARIHSRRIAKALKGTPDPTPAQVKDVLHDLGYIDLRIHGPQRSGEGVEFTLDLRLLGGELCLFAKVTGTRTVTDPYGGSSEVACPDVRRRR